MGGKKKLFLALVFLLPLSAFANAGTPLMWACMLHLAIGNAFIGLVEGLVLWRFFSADKVKSVFLMIGANYFSAWLGCMFLRADLLRVFDINIFNTEPLRIFDINIYNAGIATVLLVLFLFVLTLFLEWPFVWFCIRKNPNSVKRSLVANLIVNSLTYAPLFIWYYSASENTVSSTVKVVPSSEITLPKDLTLVFISDKEKSLRARDFSRDAQSIPIPAFADADKVGRVIITPLAGDGNEWTLQVILKNDGNCAKPEKIGYDLKAKAIPVITDPNELKMPGSTSPWGGAAVLGDTCGNHWSFYSGFWAREGLICDSDKNEHFRVAFETPLGMWYVRNAVQLPGDIVIFQLGNDQICALDANSRKLALIERGRDFAAYLKKRPE